MHEFIIRWSTVPSVLWCCWLGSRKGIRLVKNCGVLAWLSVWSEVQTYICPSWCHCHSLSLASVKSRLVLPFWYRLTWVVPEKGPLNGCVCVWSTVTLELHYFDLFWICYTSCSYTAMQQLARFWLTHRLHSPSEIAQLLVLTEVIKSKPTNSCVSGLEGLSYSDNWIAGVNMPEWHAVFWCTVCLINVTFAHTCIISDVHCAPAKSPPVFLWIILSKISQF